MSNGAIKKLIIARDITICDYRHGYMPILPPYKWGISPDIMIITIIHFDKLWQYTNILYKLCWDKYIPQ